MVFLIFWIENTAFNSLSQSQFHKRKQLASFQSRFTVYLAPHAVEPALPVSKRGAATTAPAAVQSQNVFVCHSPYMEHNETNVWCLIGPFIIPRLNHSFRPTSSTDIQSVSIKRLCIAQKKTSIIRSLAINLISV